MKNMEQNYDDLRVENFFLKEQIESKDDRIGILEEKLSVKDRVISKLEEEKEKLKAELGKFKEFWHSVIKFFQAKIGFDKDKNYKYVADDLYKNGIFNDDEKEIVNDLYRNVKVKEDKIVKVVKDKVK